MSVRNKETGFNICCICIFPNLHCIAQTSTFEDNSYACEEVEQKRVNLVVGFLYIQVIVSQVSITTTLSFCGKHYHKTCYY